MKTAIGRAAVAALCALTLSGCVDSSAPILADAEPVFGQRLRFSYYAMRDGVARDPGQASFAWNGNLYAHAGGGLRDVSALSIHSFERGEYILQTVPAKRARATEYALMRRLADGVYQVIPIDEADADALTRADYCKKVSGSSCRIETQDQLFAFARSTSARGANDGGLVVRLPDAPERPQRRAPPRRR